MRPGDVYALNAPYSGGTHLPDITLITPVFDGSDSESTDPDTQRVLFYVGSRGHHADIGGKTPGSMPPDSHSLDEEGVIIDNFSWGFTVGFRSSWCSRSRSCRRQSSEEAVMSRMSVN